MLLIVNVLFVIQLEREDALPKSVCKTCARKLDEYHSFREACVQAEIVLESNLKDQQPSAFPLEPEVHQIVVVCKLYISVALILIWYHIRFFKFEWHPHFRGISLRKNYYKNCPFFLNQMS
jgi:hypothetical protein